ncbi:MAG: HEAT repeat domain-containing protein [Planctomycetota bacterium]|nr:HEAT repeat domain-containing protein [Planctomycetota bacterium]
MGLIELCLLSALSPQGPAAGAAPAPADAAAPSGSEQAPRDLLAQLEAAGQYADAAALAQLAAGADLAAAERAAWLLANSGNDAHLEALPEVIESAPHADARLQALQGIFLHGDLSSTATAIAALKDDDRRVRTLAAKVLGKLRRPAAVEPLLQLLHATSCADGEEPTDAQAALLTLADLGASQHLLRIATEFDDDALPRCGEALTYAFQQLSPKLAKEQEATALVAVLSHREPLLRRYAITRLTELNDPRALAALDARLDAESRELRPLVEVAITQLMNTNDAQGGQLEPLAGRAAALTKRAAAWWSSKPAADKAILCAIPAAMLFGLWLIRRSLRLRAEDARAQAAAALATPSDDYLGDSYEAQPDGHAGPCEPAAGDSDEGLNELSGEHRWPQPCGAADDREIEHADPLA